MRTLSYANGDAMPILGLGTWKSAPEEVYEAVREAVRVGYRHVDCAAIYGNEAEVGRALAESFEDGVVEREEMWITSKLWNDSHARDDVRPALEKTLGDLRLDYLDLYLVHWPVAFRKGVDFPSSQGDFHSLEERPVEETWAGMEAAKETGLARHIGVSNFSREKVDALLDRAERSAERSAEGSAEGSDGGSDGGSNRQAPEVDQVELHPYLQQPDLVDYCRENGVHVTAYSPLGSLDRPERLKADDEPVLLDDPVIGEIGQRRGATPAQVLIAWAIHRGTSVIPKSVNPGRIRENFEAARLELTDEDMAEIAGLDRHRRYIDGSFFARFDSPYTVAGLWDE